MTRGTSWTNPTRTMGERWVYPNHIRTATTIKVSLAINKQAHHKFDRMTPHTNARVSVPAVTDTGIQTCTAGVDILHVLKYTNESLIRTRHRLRGVDRKSLSIIGTIIADISHGSYSCTALIYICDNVKGLYLSQTVLKQLHFIDEDFPRHLEDSKISAS